MLQVLLRNVMSVPAQGDAAYTPKKLKAMSK